MFKKQSSKNTLGLISPQDQKILEQMVSDFMSVTYPQAVKLEGPGIHISSKHALTEPLLDNGEELTRLKKIGRFALQIPYRQIYAMSDIKPVLDFAIVKLQEELNAFRNQYKDTHRGGLVWANPRVFTEDSGTPGKTLFRVEVLVGYEKV